MGKTFFRQFFPHLESLCLRAFTREELNHQMWSCDLDWACAVRTRLNCFSFSEHNRKNVFTYGDNAAKKKRHCKQLRFCKSSFFVVKLFSDTPLTYGGWDWSQWMFFWFPLHFHYTVNEGLFLFCSQTCTVVVRGWRTTLDSRMTPF